MGNSCCHTESPCGSAEERSVLLKNDSKATAPAGDTIVEGTCGPDGDDDIRKTHNEVEIKVEVKSESVQLKLSPQKKESEPNNTQENGPTTKESVQRATPSPVGKGPEPEENSTRAQDKDSGESSDASEGTELLKCTSVSEQKDRAAVDWEVFTETDEVPEVKTPDSVRNEAPAGVSLPAELLLEAEEPLPPPVETTSSTGSTLQQNEEEASADSLVDEPVNGLSGEIFEKEEVPPVPDVQAAEAEQVLSVSLVDEEKDTQEVSCVVPKDPGDGVPSEQPGPEEIKSHDVCESCAGAPPAGRHHSGEEPDSVRESEATAPADASSESLKSDPADKPDPESPAASLKVDTLLENDKHDDAEEEMIVMEQNKEEDVPKDVPKVKDDDEEVLKEEEKEEEMENQEVHSESEEDMEKQEVEVEEEEPTGSDSAHVKDEAVTEKEDVGTSEEDLYRGAEELSVSPHNKPEAASSFEPPLLKVEDRCSLAPAVDILSYSEREWRGNTAKSALIRKGYKEMSQRFSSVRRVRGDNYCALRATLYQVLSHSTQLPAWLQDADAASMLPEQLEAQEGLISQWLLPGECLQGDGTGDVTQQLKSYMELLRNKWQAAADCPSAAERQQLCERVFQGGEEELGLLEALKLLMLGRAVELHGRMQAGGDVPLFCWLLFARDSSDCPRSFLSNHLSHVGLSAGLEQVEMFLLGDALHCTIQVYRLYKADTEEFVTYYPDDHKDDWPSVCLVTEDDRHYNVPVVDAAAAPDAAAVQLGDELDSS